MIIVKAVCIPNFGSFHFLIKPNFQIAINDLGPVKTPGDPTKMYCFLSEMNSMCLGKVLWHQVIRINGSRTWEGALVRPGDP